MYVVTRKDLSPGARLAQSCHALRQFSAEHPELDKDWFETSNYLVCLEAECELELNYFVDVAESKGIRYSVFREPDLDNQLTAVTFEPGDITRRMLSRLPLAMHTVQ